MVELTEQEENQAVHVAVNAAKKATKKFGLAPGTSVAFRGDPKTYRLMKLLDNGEALIARPGTRDDFDRPLADENLHRIAQVEKVVPVSELFDVNLARRGAEYAGGLLKRKKLSSQIGKRIDAMFRRGKK